MCRDLVTYNTDLFLRCVKPPLQDLFDDKREDCWWPELLTENQVARPRAARSISEGIRRRRGAPGIEGP